MRLLDIVYIFQTYHISVLFKIVQLKLGERVSNRMISVIKKKLITDIILLTLINCIST